MKILYTLIYILFTSTYLTANNELHKLSVQYKLKGNIHSKFDDIMTNQLRSIDFKLSDPHRLVNNQYVKRGYGETTLDTLSFFSIVNDKNILPLIQKDVRIAGFSPFNVIVHKKKNEDYSYINHLSANAMLNILNIEDQSVRDSFSNSILSLDNFLENTLDTKKNYIKYESLPDYTMKYYRYDYDEPEDLDDFIDEFQNSLELAFINEGYLIAGYHNFMYAENADQILNKYDAFWTYSLCHLKFSYNVFDRDENARPDVGIFAPCTIYMYIEKGTNSVHIGMYRLTNWIETLNIKNKDRLKEINHLEEHIPTVFKRYGMKEVEFTK